MATYRYDNTVYVDIFVKKGGVWSKATTVTITHGGAYGSGGTRTLNWSATRAVQLGSGVEAFGAALAGTENGTASLTSFPSVYWVGANPGSNVRSATPSGQSSTVTVRPV